MRPSPLRSFKVKDLEMTYHLLLTPVWSIGTVENHIEAQSKDLLVGFATCFNDRINKSGDKGVVQEVYRKKLYEKVMKNIAGKLYEDVNAESGYQTVISTATRPNTHRDLFLCALYAFLEEHMKFMLKVFSIGII
uniref:Uncharacterized protein n=1 Tax=Acrobeloides nanus TaxID=290746 RepID=A0A914E9Z6_9BILA